MKPSANRLLLLSVCAILVAACGAPTGTSTGLPLSETSTTTTTSGSALQICLLPNGMQSNNCSQLAATPPFVPTMDLDAVQIGQTTWAEVDITNNGDSALDLAPLTFEGTPPAGLSIVGGWAGPLALPASQTVSVLVVLDATSSDPAYLYAILDVTQEGSPLPTAKVPIFGLVTGSSCSGTAPTASFVVKDHNVALTPDSSGAYDLTQGDTAVFDASASTPSTGVVYQWAILSEPSSAGAMLDSTGAFATLPLPVAGSYVVSLTVYQGTCGSPQITATLNVAP